MTFLLPGAWVVTSAAAISWLESVYFYVRKNHQIIVLNGYVSFLFYLGLGVNT